MRTQIAVSQRYLYICKHISRLFSGSHLTAKLGSCCPVFFLTFYAPFQDGKSLDMLYLLYHRQGSISIRLCQPYRSFFQTVCA